MFFVLISHLETWKGHGSHGLFSDYDKMGEFDSWPYIDVSCQV